MGDTPAGMNANGQSLGSLIGPDAAIFGRKLRDKGQLLGELAREASVRLGIDAAIILAALGAREALGSTGLGRGFALPHARVAGVGRLFGLFMRLARPIAFDEIDGVPVDLVCLLLIPPASGQEHVAALAVIARAVRDAAFVARLRAAPDVGEFHRLLSAAG